MQTVFVSKTLKTNLKLKKYFWGFNKNFRDAGFFKDRRKTEAHKFCEAYSTTTAGCFSVHLRLYTVKLSKVVALVAARICGKAMKRSIWKWKWSDERSQGPT